MALSGQIRATYDDDREVPKRLTVPKGLGLESLAPLANVPVVEETDGAANAE